MDSYMATLSSESGNQPMSRPAELTCRNHKHFHVESKHPMLRLCVPLNMCYMHVPTFTHAHNMIDWRLIGTTRPPKSSMSKSCIHVFTTLLT